MKTSPRQRGGTPWRGRKPRRASASGPPNKRSGGTDPRGEQHPEVGLSQFGPRTTATSASVRSPSGGRTHFGRAPSGVVPGRRRSFGSAAEPVPPASARPSSWWPRAPGARREKSHVSGRFEVGYSGFRPSGRTLDAVTAQSGQHGVTSRPSRRHVTPSGAARRRGGCFAGPRCRARLLLGGSEHGDGNSRARRACPKVHLGLPSTSLRGCVRQVPKPGFDPMCHGRRGRGVPAEKATTRGYQASRGERLLEGETLWRAQPQGRSRHETRPEGLEAEWKARSGEKPNVPATRVRQARDDLPPHA